MTILIIAPSFLYLYLLTVTTNYFSVLKDNLFLMIVCILSIVGSLLASIFAIRLSNSLKNKEILEQKLDFMEQYEKLSEDYSSMVKGNLMEMRKIRHDFNNAIQVIQAMIMQNNLEEATQLSEQLQNEYTALSNQEFCENITINTILQQEQRNCEKNNIALHVSCKVPKELPVSQVDLCSILTNLLHNAERAVLEIPENTELKRRISLSVWIEGDMLMFRITNPNKNPIIEKNGKLVTTKTDKKNHGLGMEIIRQIAIQYNGDVHIEHDDSNFTVLVMLGLVNTSSN
ncbi:MAG: GHKL domain-containing protein [Ruminococcus sp.]|nr:GHKL domain-containing protein [Ruminococcus sp.]